MCPDIGIHDVFYINSAPTYVNCVRDVDGSQSLIRGLRNAVLSEAHQESTARMCQCIRYVK